MGVMWRGESSHIGLNSWQQ